MKEMDTEDEYWDFDYDPNERFLRLIQILFLMKMMMFYEEIDIEMLGNTFQTGDSVDYVNRWWCGLILRY